MKLKNFNKIYLFFCLFLFHLSAFSADISLKTRTLIENHNSSSKKAKLVNESEKINLFIIINNDFDKNSLDSLDISIESDFGDVLTLLAPVENLAALAEINGIDYISVGVEAKPQLDVAVPLVRADMVHRGENLEQAYTGKDVIVGFVDLGLDFTHPAFRAADGSLRISRVWIQSESGNAPSGFRYGTEYVGKNALLGKRYSNDAYSHGTHVCGIAAGSGNFYAGIAPEAEIVFVETGGTDTQIVDGVKYIFNYAAAQKKPAVVNISMGTHYGPHDGKSTTDKAFDSMTGAGKIIVGSAGNNGADSLHIRKNFTTNTDTLRSIIDINLSEDNGNKSTIAIVWGDANSDFQAAYEVYNLKTKECVFRTEFLNTARNTTTLNKTYQKISLKMNVIRRYLSNQKPIIEIEIANPMYENYGVAIVLVGNAGHSVDLWNNAHNSSGAPFFALEGTTASGWQAGNTTSSITEIGGTGEQVITVGSFDSKAKWFSYSAQRDYTFLTVSEGEISFWSSRGPTADGRTKPDITAPGAGVVSAVNSFASDFSLTSANKECLVLKENNHFYGIMQGTSMSAPVVTGAVALMLQKNPDLTPADIKELLREFSRQDDFTGTIDENGSNTWGWGKLDVYDIVSSRKILPKPKIKNVIVFYDVQSKNIILQTEKEYRGETDYHLEISRVEIFDLSGRKLIDKQNVFNQTVNVASLKGGIYIVKISSSSGNAVRKALIY